MPRASPARPGRPPCTETPLERGSSADPWVNRVGPVVWSRRGPGSEKKQEHTLLKIGAEWKIFSTLAKKT